LSDNAAQVILKPCQGFGAFMLRRNMKRCGAV
jgi:hypothetical protein